VVVVGGGAAGLCAAVAAADAGREVILIEAADALGGTTVKSAAIYWVPNNHIMRAAGVTDSAQDAIKYMARLAFPTRYVAHAPRFGLSDPHYDLIAAYYELAAPTVAALEELGALRSIEAVSIAGNPEGYPDYHSDLPEDLAPYGRHLQPRTADGEAGLGPELIAQLSAAAERLGVEVLLGHRAKNLLRTPEGDVVGVEAEARDDWLRIEARRGVVFGSGGFTHAPDLALEFLRGPIFGGGAVPTNRGDFLRAATALGAELGNMSMAWFAEIPLEPALEEPSPPNNVWIPYGDSMLIVNRYGRRVVDEKLIYHERTMAHFHWDGARWEYPNLLLFMVYDDAVAKDPRDWPMRWPVPLPGERATYVVSGDTLPELECAVAARLRSLEQHTGGVELAPEFASTLEASIRRFNEFAAAGLDRDFSRGERQIEIDWSGPAREGNNANPTMSPLAASGPYHCIVLAPGTLDTCGGPKIDRNARVLGAGGVPIPGLFGAGNCVASISGQGYWSGGATIGPALTFGFVAGRGSAAEPLRETERGRSIPATGT
jgi:succinate dehydrogenase/fumarate reductase flavoprotein subunit